MNKAGERLYNGIIKENPTLVLMLGMCPTLAVTTKAMNGLGMGLTTTVVLALSNLIISLLRRIIPNRVRIPAFIVIIASFVIMMQLLLQAYLPSLNTALGVYIPLIVVNCIILGRAESYAYSNPPIPSFFDGLGMGLGFTMSLTVIGALREILGSGKFFDRNIMPAGFVPIRIFGLAPGAFFVLALLCAAQNYVKRKAKEKGKDVSKIQSGCGQDCLNCGESGCAQRFYDNGQKESEKEEKEAATFRKIEEVKIEAAKVDKEVQEEVQKAEAKAGKEVQEEVQKAEAKVDKEVQEEAQKAEAKAGKEVQEEVQKAEAKVGKEEKKEVQKVKADAQKEKREHIQKSTKNVGRGAVGATTGKSVKKKKSKSGNRPAVSGRNGAKETTHKEEK